MLIDNCVAPLAPPLLQRLLHLSCHPPPPRSTRAHTHTCAVHLCVYPVFRGDLADTLPAGLIVATQDATSATSYVIVVKSVSILTGGSACRDLCRDGGKKGNKKERKKKEKEKKTFPRSSPFDLSVAVGFFGEFIDDPYPFFAHARHAYAFWKIVRFFSRPPSRSGISSVFDRHFYRDGCVLRKVMHQEFVAQNRLFLIVLMNFYQIFLENRTILSRPNRSRDIPWVFDYYFYHDRCVRSSSKDDASGIRSFLTYLWILKNVYFLSKSYASILQISVDLQLLHHFYRRVGCIFRKMNASGIRKSILPFSTFFSAQIQIPKRYPFSP